MPGEEFSTIMTNRSIRTIKAELEFLADASLITQQQLSSIVSQLPSQTPVSPPTQQPPVAQMANLNVQSPPSNTYNEKQQNSYFASPSPAPTPGAVANPPPPAYPSAPAPPSVLCYATSLYAFAPTDAGDLGFAAQERIGVTEYMNSEWWKGRSEKTGQEGIFPRAYVRVEDNLPPKSPTATAGASSNYGNMPLDVSQSGSGQNSGPPSKTEEQGKKFGKKLGNAAIFGAGATIGGKIVNGIF